MYLFLWIGNIFTQYKFKTYKSYSDVSFPQLLLSHSVLFSQDKCYQKKIFRSIQTMLSLHIVAYCTSCSALLFFFNRTSYFRDQSKLIYNEHPHLFYGCLMFHWMDVPYFFNQSPIEGHLDCFQPIISSAAKDNFIHMPFARVQVYFRESSYRGIAVSEDVCFCNLAKWWQIAPFSRGVAAI